MRISKIPLAGLALVLAGGGAKTAFANDVSITNDTTTPLSTSAPDGVSPGNVTVTSTGSITIDGALAAITIDSDNSVDNQGDLNSNDDDNSRGIVMTGGFTGAVTNSGAISLLEDFTLPDSDSDGDPDGPWALGTNRIGIFLGAGGAFTGNVTNSGTIVVEGVDSAGLRLDALLNGNVVSTGDVAVAGDNSRGIAFTGGTGSGVSGDVIIRGGVNVRGENAFAILADAPIGGELRIGGEIVSSGYHFTSRPATQAAIDALDADDLLQSSGALGVHYDVAGGVTIEGVGVEDDEDDDADGATEADGDLDDDATGSVTALGEAPAVWIAPNAAAPATLNLGATASGYGFVNRGVISASGVYDGFSGTGVRIEGAGGAGVNVAGGFLNDGGIAASGFEADAFGFYFGADATVPTLINRRTLGAQSVTENDHTAYAVYIAPGASTASIVNGGVMSAQLFGEVGDAVVVRDLSNTLSLFENSGTVQARVVGTDTDLTDDIIPEPAGDTVVLDVSTSTIAVTYRQIADVAFTDDDANDDDVNSRPIVRTLGDILFGAGADNLELLDGDMFSNVSFGAGADSFTLDGGARFTGTLADADGALSLDVIDGTLGLAGGTLNLTTAHFGPNSELLVLVSPEASETTTLLASGTITFDAGAVVTPIIPSGLPQSGTEIFLTAAGGLIGGANVERVITGDGAPWIYNLSVGVAQSDANSLEARYVLKSADELGFNANQAAAFNPILDALRTDETAAMAFASLTTEFGFIDSYQDLLPDYSSAAAEMAATAVQQTQSATTNRIATTRMSEVDQVSVWAQEIGYGVNREPETSLGVEYRGYGFGLALGIDGPLENGALFGLSASFITSEVEEPGRKDGEISASFAQANAYLGTSLGPIDLDLVGGGGLGKMRSRRFVSLGDNFLEIAEAEWWAYEIHGAVRASAPQRLGQRLTLTPYTQLTYVGLSEEGYTESGGGSAIDLDVDETFSQRLWADAGVQIAALWRTRAGSTISPHISAGYRANAIDEAADRSMQFAYGGGSFTLTDDTEGTGGPVVGLGLDATNGYSTFSIAYEGEYGDQLTRHSLNAALRFRF